MEKSHYSLDVLGRMAALVLDGERKAAGAGWSESQAGARVANRLARFSAVMARSLESTDVYGEAEIAWEAAKAYGAFGDWSSEEIREVKQRIKGMIVDAEVASNALAVNDDVDFVYWLAATFMAVVLE